MIEREEAEGRPVSQESSAEEKRSRQQFSQRMDIEDQDIIIQGSNPTRLSRKQVCSWLRDFVSRSFKLEESSFMAKSISMCDVCGSSAVAKLNQIGDFK